MIIKGKLRIILLLTVISLTLCQSGGGGGSGGGSNGGSRHSSKGSRHHGHHGVPFVPPKSGCSQTDCPKLKKQCITNCQQNFSHDKTQFKNCEQQCGSQYGTQRQTDWRIPAVMVTSFIGLVIWTTKNKKQQGHDFIKNHLENIKQFEYSQDELNQKFQIIKKIKQIINFRIGQGVNSFSTSQFKIQGKKLKQKCLYSITIKSNDSVGSWSAQGFIAFSNEGTQIWFSKAYYNRQQAGQTGRWYTLIYEGKLSQQKGNIFEGIWYYKGFQNDNKYSGTWKTQTIKND